MRTTFVFTTLVVVVPALGAPARVPITKRAGPVKPDCYLIKLKDVAVKANTADAFSKGFTDPESSVTHIYDHFNGFAATIKSSDLSAVQSRDDVECIEPDSIFSIASEQGLDGFSEVVERSETSSTSLFDKRTDKGEGVDIYGVDTGIYTDHQSFGGRAIWGATFGGYPDADGHGHGTHAAALAAGEGFGHATSARIIAVKALGDDGKGALSDVMCGIEFAMTKSIESQKPSIVTISSGALTQSKAMTSLVQKASQGGLHFTVAAGNNNENVKFCTPGSIPEVNTIGAVDAQNQKLQNSNYGQLITAWAPGGNITSAWIGEPGATKVLSGTSVAAPQVAGILAVALGKYGQMSPKDLTTQLKTHAADVVTFSMPDRAASFHSNHLLAQEW